MNSSENQYAGFWVRVASISIDSAFITSIYFTMIILLSNTIHPFLSTDNFLKVILCVLVPLTLITSFSYYVWYNASGRQTIGKKIFGLVVVDKDLQPITTSKSIIRTLLFFIDSIIYSLGHLFIIFSKRKQTLHDLISNTYVINKELKHRQAFIYISILIGSIFIMFIFGLSARIFVQAFSIPTSAMENTLLVGDLILVDKVDGNQYVPRSGDIIVFKYPKDENLSYIKRCIATGGQTVEIIDKIVYVDGKIFPNSTNIKFIDKRIIPRPTTKYGIRTFHNLGSRDNYGPITIPENAYWVMGDNRDNSEDSRYWGFVPQENIIGQAGIIYFSKDFYSFHFRWNRIGKLVK